MKLKENYKWLKYSGMIPALNHMINHMIAALNHMINHMIPALNHMINHMIAALNHIHKVGNLQ